MADDFQLADWRDVLAYDPRPATYNDWPLTVRLRGYLRPGDACALSSRMDDRPSGPLPKIGAPQGTIWFNRGTAFDRRSAFFLRGNRIYVPSPAGLAAGEYGAAWFPPGLYRVRVSARLGLASGEAFRIEDDSRLQLVFNQAVLATTDPVLYNFVIDRTFDLSAGGFLELRLLADATFSRTVAGRIEIMPSREAPV
jgi:hypothetical protein